MDTARHLHEELSPHARRLVPAAGREDELRALLSNLYDIQRLAQGRAVSVPRDRAVIVDRAVESLQEQVAALAINLGLVVEAA